MNLEVFVLGTGGMMPLPNRFLTSMLIRREGDLLLFDCGEGTQVSLRKLNLKWKKISAIFISHTHADHVTGLPGILMLSSQVDRDDPLYIYGPPKIREYVEENRRVLDMYINYEIIVKELDGPGIVYEQEEYTIRSFELRHTKPCVGYTLEEKPRPGVFFPEKAAALGIPRGPLWSKLQTEGRIVLDDGRLIESSEVMGPPRMGRKVSFVTDTQYLPTIAPNVSDSNLLICEGMFTDEFSESAAAKKHLTARQAGMIARQAGGIKQMGLIHYSPRYTEKELKQLQVESQECFPETFLTRDRQVIPIPYEE